MKKILIADDKASSRELLRTLLEHAGYEVLESADGIEALEIARVTLPDLIILDLHMPRLDGYGAVGEMRRDERLKHLPIVALTASATHTDCEKVMNAGFTAHISKPVKLAVLRDEVKRLLSGPAETTQPPPEKYPSRSAQIR